MRPIPNYLSAVDNVPIPGWFSTRLIPLIAAIDDAQRGTAGSIVEIGVHAGRSLIPLAACRRPGERCVAIDPALSGPDARDSVQALIDGDGLRCELIARRSVDALWPTSIRLAHIDGDHSYSTCLADLQRADTLALPNAVLIVDDAFNQAWPDVGHAVQTFVTRSQQHAEHWKPFALGWGRTFLCRSPHYAHFFRVLSSLGPTKRSHYLHSTVCNWLR